MPRFVLYVAGLPQDDLRLMIPAVSDRKKGRNSQALTYYSFNSTDCNAALAKKYFFGSIVQMADFQKSK